METVMSYVRYVDDFFISIGGIRRRIKERHKRLDDYSEIIFSIVSTARNLCNKLILKLKFLCFEVQYDQS